MDLGKLKRKPFWEEGAALLLLGLGTGKAADIMSVAVTVATVLN